MMAVEAYHAVIRTYIHLVALLARLNFHYRTEVLISIQIWAWPRRRARPGGTSGLATALPRAHPAGARRRGAARAAARLGTAPPAVSAPAGGARPARPP